ncbi:Alpha/beta hydrolase family-domain-containing protein [Dactylonectria macrodidyma]|uniref:Alpha/beta hydrolase family-domain-containing protein n=1 Tax=Dactylonectria macrodidyma TaxID=307937 RepID=A0A9P9F9V3_9HYPO|nr:Alpha/beta hydrolase family-domain-containing protein [Dactylonectria macrodidyma]
MTFHNARSPSTRPLSPFGRPLSSDDHPHEMDSVDTSEFGEDELCLPSNGSKEALCSRTTFFVNADWRMGSTLTNATTIVGQMYVECLDPIKKLHPYPIVLIHGDFHTGQMTKPDGNPGWASYFLRQGFQVYIVDLPPCGRSNFLTASHFIHRDLGRASHTLAASYVEMELTAPGKEPAHGQPLIPLRHSRASMHNKWPGAGQRGDPIFTNYCASLVTLHLNKVERQSLGQNALRALLVKIGKAVLVGEGSGGNMSWLANDVSPELVAGVIAIEPAGPPFGTALPKSGNPRIYTQFIERDGATRLYGLTDIPLTYDPPCHPHDGFERPAKDPLDVVRKLRPDRLGACLMQQTTDTDLIEVSSDGKPMPGQQKVRQLIHLKKVPHALITAHASSHTVFDWATVSFMKQAGVDVDWLRLEDFGILGNGHLMFLEVNSDEVASVVERWILGNITQRVPGAQPMSLLTTSESPSMIASQGRTSKKANHVGHTSAFRHALPGRRPTAPVGLSESALCSLSRHTPLTPIQHQLRNQSAIVQSSGPTQMAFIDGKRPAGLSSAEKAPTCDKIPGMGIRTSSQSAQDAKRHCMGNGVKALSVPMGSPSGKFPIPQLSQQQHIRAFQNMQGQVHGRTVPQLRQQVQPATRPRPASPYHTSTTLAPILRPSTPQGAPLYAHLSGNKQPTTDSSDATPMVLAESESSGSLPQVFKHITFSDESIKSLASTPLHRVMGNLEPTPEPSAHPTATTVRQQLDSKAEPRTNTLPIDPQLSQVSTPAHKPTSPEPGNIRQTPSDPRKRDLDTPQGSAFSKLPALTPPSPSPAPRPPVG